MARLFKLDEGKSTDDPIEEDAEKRLFCALRFATRMPAAARNCYSSVTYGTSKLVP